MKTMIKLASLALIVLLGISVSAQEWNKEQLEVWKVVENSWAKWKAGDAAGATAALHPEYQGWSDESPLPMGKEAVSQWFQTMASFQTVEGYFINPARIVVSGNAAVVHYYFQYSVTYAMGDAKKHEEGKGKYVEFYVKEGNQWLCLGDMTVHGDEEDDED